MSDEVSHMLLGRYRILARCGDGGFGTVFSCWDTRLERRVAIKQVTLSAGTRTVSIDNALSEARIACLLTHPNIAGLYDFETDQNFAYLIMEYVDGLDLAQIFDLTKDGMLTPDECACVFEGVCKALAYAHENGVLHLDIKPANIMITQEGLVKLTDFGVASLASVGGFKDVKGGTPGYMPPEQIEGILVDKSSDIFSFALVMWEALTGKNPFLIADTDICLERIKRGPTLKICDVRDDIDPHIEEILREALSFDAENRPYSIDNFMFELSPFLGNAKKGAKQLRELISTEEKPVDMTDDDAGNADSLLDRIENNFSWLEGVATRILSAALTFLLLREFLLQIPSLDIQTVYGASLSASTAAAIWPPLLSLFALAALAAQLIMSNRVYYAVAVCVFMLLWWIWAGKKEHLASVAMFLPLSTNSPVAGAGLAGFCLDPIAAAGTAFIGYVLRGVIEDTLDIFSLSFWVLGVSVVFAAGVSSAVALKGRVRDGIFGQIIGCVFIIVAVFASSLMENGSLLGSQSGEICVYALVFCLVSCVFCIVRGPLYDDREGKNTK